MQSQPYRPTVIAIAAEYVEDAYVWDHSPGEAGGLEPAFLTDLGASNDLLTRLSAWNDTYALLPGTDFQWRTEQSEADWHEEGLQLSLELQRQLPDVEVHYGSPDDSRPSMRERLGMAPLHPAPRPIRDEPMPGAYAYAPIARAVYTPSPAPKTPHE